EDRDVPTELLGVLHDLSVYVRAGTDLEEHAALREPLAQRGVLGGVDTVPDALRLEVLQDLVHGMPVLVLTRVHREAESGPARLLEQSRIVAVLEVRMR